MMLQARKVTVRDLRGKELGEVERIDDRKYLYSLRRIRGYAASYSDAVAILRDLNRILPRTSKEKQRGTTRTRTQPPTTSRRG